MSGKAKAPEPVSQHEDARAAYEVSQATASPQFIHSPPLSLAASSLDMNTRPNHTVLGLYAPHQEAGVVYFVVQELYRWTFQDRSQGNAEASQEISEPTIRVTRVQYGTIEPPDAESQRRPGSRIIANSVCWKLLRAAAILIVLGAAYYVALRWYWLLSHGW